jgi:apolipoprotein N-acyltransferase
MIDSYGHVQASLPLDAQGVLVARLPNAQPATLFSRLGLKIPVILGVVAVITGLLISTLI